MRFFLILTVTILFFSCNLNTKGQSLPLDAFNYTEELKNTMKTLTKKTEWTDLSKEIVLVTGNKFSVTNKYAIPFLYNELQKYAVPIEEYTKEEIEGFLNYTALNRALTYAMYLEAKQKGFDVTDDAVKERLNKISNGNIDAFRQTIEKGPFKFEFVMEDIKRVEIIEKFKDNFIIKDVTVDSKEIKDYYDKNPSVSLINPKAEVRHILLLTQGIAKKEKDKKFEQIKKILAEAKSGKDFAELAKKYSEDTGSKNSGGKLGDFIEKGQSVKEFDNAIFNTKEGQVSDVFETEYGFHIVKVDKLITNGKKKLPDVKDQIQEIIKIEKQNKAIDKAKQDIEKKYNIKVAKVS
ncbi:MAG: hypothetical protein A2086_11705 [Spirochaetes bacterium GWD1_27_9]|nr:MAG: hypothetical protein A2Z98_07440 [Spirochaetes bacterium GWB1_27_13]OHD28628.1 MAG: hypothetical protein A2086_11705 [Spirochaetes bacterium GWD1_27_9]